MEDEIKVLERKLQDEAVWNDAPAALRDSTRLGELRKKLLTYRTYIQPPLQYSLKIQLTRKCKETWSLSWRRCTLAPLSILFHSGYPSRPIPTQRTLMYELAPVARRLVTLHPCWLVCIPSGDTHAVSLTVDESLGDVAGIKSTTLLVTGPYAYGYAQYETGVHRLVRVSPFDSAGARHTSFASVRVSPYFDENSDDVGIELNVSDLKITTMRSQGAGGQHVNKTESAVRIVHVPSGITVTCQQERSQHRNRAVAMSLLKSRLYEVEMQKKAQTKVEAYNTLPEIGWGSQIRSYVLHPYQLIKDARTGHEVGTAGYQGVLDGELGGFMEASLRKFRRG